MLGGTSSLDNVSSCSKELTNNFLRNFYINGVLKSVPSRRDALALIQEVIELCQRRENSSWQKLYSNKKYLLFAIPDALKKDGAKDQDLTGSFPIKKTLGIFWEYWESCNNPANNFT